MKFKPHARHGTDEDLKKLLLVNYPGCKTVSEALEKEKKNRIPSPPQDLPSLTPVDVLRTAILDIQNHLNNFDIDFMDQELRLSLSKIPLDSVENITRWRDEWLKIEL